MLRLPAPTPDTPTFAELDAALERLTAATPARWGVMDAPAMVEHSGRFVDLYLGKVPVALPIRLIARALGRVFLTKIIKSSPMKTPRNLRTLGAIRVEAAAPDQAGADTAAPDWASAVAALRGRLAEVDAITTPYRHVFYGPIDPESAKVLVRHHTAHHFHQFGLFEGAEPS